MKRVNTLPTEAPPTQGAEVSRLKRFEDPETGWRLYAESEEHKNKGQFYISVTTILDHITHHRLKNFYKNNTPKAIDKKMTIAADKGTYIHDFVERDLLGESIIIDPAMESPWKEWQTMKAKHRLHGLGQTVKPRPEVQVFSNLYGAAGTADYVGPFYNPETDTQGVSVGDWKSGRYSIKTGWQLAAYRAFLIETQGYPKDMGMFGGSLPADGRPGKVFVYQHIESCWIAFLASWVTFKMLYYNHLKDLNWAWLHIHPLMERPRNEDVGIACSVNELETLPSGTKT